jgi:hypothetical protein
MIDVFMLVRANILTIDNHSNAIDGVTFCECMEEDYTAIKDIIAREDSGLLGRLEDVVLFRDDEYTARFATEGSISEALADEEVAADERGERLRLKQRQGEFRATFPYDFLNLDFCDYFYNPPQWMQISETLLKILDWQRGVSGDGRAVSVDAFTVAVTCRHDDEFPEPALSRLRTIVDENARTTPGYAQGLTARGTSDIAAWSRDDTEDFFLSAWPKDVARAAAGLMWNMSILDYVFYDRENRTQDKSYKIICLIIRFERATTVVDYTPAAVAALDRDARVHIQAPEPSSAEASGLREDLSSLAQERNVRARAFGAPELPPVNW